MKSNKCVCPKNTKLINGECKKDVLNKCKGGEMRAGQCVCFHGKKLINGECQFEKNIKCVIILLDREAIKYG